MNRSGNRLIDLTGQKFGRLTVLCRDPKPHRKDARWICECECGNKAAAVSRNLKSGNTRSYGCLFKEGVKEFNKTHGMSYTPTHNAWCGMKKRCLNPEEPAYPYYGGRGIKVCERWIESFEAFLEDMGEAPPDTSIDRIDVNGNYEPGNCRWADQKTQARNKRTNRTIKFRGEVVTLAEFAERLGMKFSTLYVRVESGWTAEEIASTPVSRNNTGRRKAK